MKQAFDGILILCVIATAWICQWIAYRNGFNDGKKIAKKQKHSNEKSEKSHTKTLDELK